METKKNDTTQEKYTDLIDIYIDNILRLEENKVVSKDFAGFLLGFLLRRGLAKEVESYLQSILREKRRKETYMFLNYESKHTDFSKIP